MRKPVTNDVESIQRLYDEATLYANNVGFIDWPKPFPVEVIETMITNNELYVWGDESPIAAVKLSPNVPENIWGNSEENDTFLYLGKLAGSSSIRGIGYVEEIIMNDVIEFAKSQSKLGIRLDCLAENERLCNLYSRFGYESQGISTLLSQVQNQELTVQRFELAI